VKDVVDVAGTPTGAGHPTWLTTHDPATRDAVALAALLATGATMTGKTHTDELAYSLFGTNAHYGAVDNPRAPGHLTGGSSSGTAAAVAAGLADLGLGTDTAGSIRVPAAWCGLYGLRPSHARVSREGIVPLAPSYDVPALLADDPRILRAGAAAILASSESADEPRRLHLPADLWALADPEVDQALRPAVAALAGDRPTCSAPLFPGPSEHVGAFTVRQGWEFWRTHGAWINRYRPEFGPGVGARVRAAAARSVADLAEADAVLATARSTLHRAVDGGTVLVFPTVPAPAPAHGESAGPELRQRLLRLTCLASLAGLPALTVPAGRVAGRPVGLSLIGPVGADEALLALIQSRANRAAG
jgi:amidase